jgi:antitoxin component of MazEF toxin-antitoxin module
MDKNPESLEELIEKITPENKHEALDWGPDVGKEILD